MGSCVVIEVFFVANYERCKKIETQHVEHGKFLFEFEFEFENDNVTKCLLLELVS